MPSRLHTLPWQLRCTWNISLRINRTSMDSDSGIPLKESFDASTEELKRKWAEQRQKRENISSAMGQYLLKGYRMLATTCEACGNILLQTRDGANYCVQCSEFGETRPNDDAKVEPAGKKVTIREQAAAHAWPAAPSAVLGTAHEALLHKLHWASAELKGTTSVEYSVALCRLVKACSEALQSVAAAKSDPDS